MNQSSNRRQSWFGREWSSAREWLASDRLRRVRMALFQGYILIALLAFGGLAALVSAFPVLNLDIYITHELQELPHWVLYLMYFISWFGFGFQSGLMIVIVCVLLFGYGLRWEAISAFFAAVASIALNTLVKVAIQRPRPTANLVEVAQQVAGFSFPSGHVMFYTAFFGFLLFLVFTLLKRSWYRNVLSFLLLAMVALVGPSRMFLGEHWGSDVLGGYLLGSLTLILSIRFYQWGKMHYFVPQPVAVTGRTETVETPEEQKEIHEAMKNPAMPKPIAKEIEKNVPQARQAADVKDAQVDTKNAEKANKQAAKAESSGDSVKAEKAREKASDANTKAAQSNAAASNSREAAENSARRSKDMDEPVDPDSPDHA